MVRLYVQASGFQSRPIITPGTQLYRQMKMIDAWYVPPTEHVADADVCSATTTLLPELSVKFLHDQFSSPAYSTTVVVPFLYQPVLVQTAPPRLAQYGRVCTEPQKCATEVQSPPNGPEYKSFCDQDVKSCEPVLGGDTAQVAEHKLISAAIMDKLNNKTKTLDDMLLFKTMRTK